ncbi:hypothetical protein L1049_021395 [Liquidambar formosana]|uniref:DUF659 domain-containing protein n=1 Tax=Liquidambar formosana TaxID=63359 RepID=A0AAP0R625_LIQFO
MPASEVSVNVHDHGSPLDEKKKRIQCNYCNKVVSGFYRLRCHLGGIRGDVTPCEEVPENIKQLIKNELLEKRRGNLTKEVGEPHVSDLSRKRSWCSDLNRVNHQKFKATQTARSVSRNHVKKEPVLGDASTEGASTSNGRTSPQRVVDSEEGMDLSLKQARKCIGRFFYEVGIDVSAARSPAFHKMVNAILGYPQIVKEIPTVTELRGSILQDEVKELQQCVKDIRNSWVNTGCSILLDGWSDEKGRNLVNILVDCPRGTIYLHSYDISTYVGDVNALQLLISGVIEEVGVENVVQIVSYSTSGCMEAVGKLLMEKHRTVFWTVSASHCLELILEKIGLMGPVKGVLDKVKTIIKFIHSNATVLRLMRNYTNSHDLAKPSKFRLAIPFLTLENMVLEKENLENMFVSFEWKTLICASSRNGKMVADLVGDPSFWTEAGMVLNATIPLVRVLCLINEADKPQMGYIYDTMDQAKEMIKKEFKHKKAQYMPFWEVIDGIWNNYLYSPLHAAGYFLNPSYYYSSDFYIDSEVASGLLCCIIRMVQDCRIQDIVSLQIDEYREAKGVFKQGSDIDVRTKTPPALWWSNYGGQCPELQRLAIRILSQTCDGALRYRLKRSLAEKLLTNGRNQGEQQQLNDQAFVHYNLQLQHYESGRDGEIGDEELHSTDDWIEDKA